jgi:hypothetical protein
MMYQMIDRVGWRRHLQIRRGATAANQHEFKYVDMQLAAAERAGW